MGTYNPNYRYSSNLLRGLKGLISAVIIGVTSTHEPPSSVCVCVFRPRLCDREGPRVLGVWGLKLGF